MHFLMDQLNSNEVLNATKWISFTFTVKQKDSSRSPGLNPRCSEVTQTRHHLCVQCPLLVNGASAAADIYLLEGIGRHT